jgi:hypothetical protein
VRSSYRPGRPRGACSPYPPSSRRSSPSFLGKTARMGVGRRHRALRRRQ